MTDTDPAVIRQIAEVLEWEPGPDREVAYKCYVPDNPPDIRTDKALQRDAIVWLYARWWTLAQHVDDANLWDMRPLEADDDWEPEWLPLGHALLAAMRQELGI